MFALWISEMSIILQKFNKFLFIVEKCNFYINTKIVDFIT